MSGHYGNLDPVPPFHEGRQRVVVYESKHLGSCKDCHLYRPLFEEERTHDMLCCDCLVTRDPKGMQWWFLSLSTETQ